MKQADIYLLESPRTSDQLHFCCRLAEKAFQQGMIIHIQAGSPQQAEDLNDILWNFKPESFLPHSIGQGQHQEFPITLDVISLQKGHRDLLVLLSPVLPDNVKEFGRVALITTNHPADLQGSRQVYRQIQNAVSGEDVPINIHDMRSAK